jgi:hypothetical protein
MRRSPAVAHGMRDTFALSVSQCAIPRAVKCCMCFLEKIARAIHRKGFPCDSMLFQAIPSYSIHFMAMFFQAIPCYSMTFQNIPCYSMTFLALLFLAISTTSVIPYDSWRCYSKTSLAIACDCKQFLAIACDSCRCDSNKCLAIPYYFLLFLANSYDSWPCYFKLFLAIPCYSKLFLVIPYDCW